jgi:TetR/AcrR family transcriptional regulator, transcriptional repressor for nem operon
MTDTKTQLLNHATSLIQRRGYNGFSFHDLADLTGIKTASIHYHFPTKNLLGQAVIDRYTRDFIEALGDSQVGSPESRLRHYASLFRKTITADCMCLCGMIGAEIGGLPEELKLGVSKFFDANRDWLIDVLLRKGLPRSTAKIRALLMISVLEGAMLMFRAKGEITDFDAVVKLALVDAVGST